jgi:NAD(P)-dependent dehydrogenase (short-subunit alcohol dehydrogenase family)
MLTREYDGKQAYGQSKLALAMLTLDLAVVLQSRVSQPAPFTRATMNKDGEGSRIAGTQHRRRGNRGSLPPGHLLGAQ